jgi:hypothetical protein
LQGAQLRLQSVAVAVELLVAEEIWEMPSKVDVGEPEKEGSLLHRSH